MTLTQLEAFVLVARLGSVKAAAKVLGVSEPAVSGALAALRQHLGDPLVERTPTGMELTVGGKRLIPIASQMVNLAVEAEAAIRDAQGAPELLRVVATSTVAEFMAPGLLAVFTARGHALEATGGAGPRGALFLGWGTPPPPPAPPPAATRLRRFLGTPDAMHVMHRADRSVPVSRFRPPVYVTLWS